MTPLVLSKRAAARLLGVGRSNTLETLIAEGRIRAVSIAGRIKIPREEIERIAREGTEVLPVVEPKQTRKRQPPKDLGDAINDLDY